jgi:hypothetical protein
MEVSRGTLKEITHLLWELAMQGLPLLLYPITKSAHKDHRYILSQSIYSLPIGDGAAKQNTRTS